MKKTYFERFLAGEYEQVWKELMRLGAKVRNKPYFDDAWAVAQETMRRVKINVEILKERLPKIGYVFQNPERAHKPPSVDLPEYVQKIEQILGPFPLSTKAFGLIVGSVDFCLAGKYQYRSYETPPDILLGTSPHLPLPVLNKLGYSDPLVVYPLDAIPAKEYERHAGAKAGELDWSISPELNMKANCSGGPNYEYRMPDPRADAVLVTYYDERETFVKFLRESFKNGGFRGQVGLTERGVAYAPFPQHELLKELRLGLLPI